MRADQRQQGLRRLPKNRVAIERQAGDQADRRPDRTGQGRDQGGKVVLQERGPFRREEGDALHLIDGVAAGQAKVELLGRAPAQTQARQPFADRQVLGLAEGRRIDHLQTEQRAGQPLNLLQERLDPRRMASQRRIDVGQEAGDVETQRDRLVQPGQNLSRHRAQGKAALFGQVETQLREAAVGYHDPGGEKQQHQRYRQLCVKGVAGLGHSLTPPSSTRP